HEAEPQPSDEVALIGGYVSHELRDFYGFDPCHVFDAGAFLEDGLGVDVSRGIARASPGHDPVLENRAGALEDTLC
ncbi:hypothetical protein, partial [Escherichia coli]|uniref:hypothetical protein n=1 Tax=Escherichia coli TaxID=562 RepID=UPI0019D69657